MIRLFVSDIDGTLIDDNGQISTGTVEAIRRAHDSGVKFMLATGRMHYGATRVWQEIGLDIPMIASQGAVIFNPMDGRFIRKRKLPKDKVMKLIDFAESRGLYMHIYTDKGFCYNRYRKFTTLYENNSHTKGTLAEDIRSAVEDEGSYKFLVVEHSADMPALQSECEKLFGDEMTVTRSTPAMLEFLDKGVSKGQAVIDFAEMYGIKKEEIACCGNELNDVTMIRAAGIGLAVANASEVLKCEADGIIPSNNDEGVRWAIEKYVLGGNAND